jgi:hypothetical protein
MAVNSGSNKNKDSCATPLRRTAQYSLLHRRRDYILEVKVDVLEGKLAQYKQKGLNHVSRIEDIRHKKSPLLLNILLI